ncbi:hypothetical protein C1H57_05250 [Clostridium sp. 2-1]|uniref:hypothetical protein n=1 Tax=Clostridium TaxID=1485 RepID=UPI000CDAC708|nr:MULTISPECIES: hypothetical protein [Clostridium]MBN7573397.1 hypothetical protein [Clostridium beijerinckii]MBN7578735.1 hypothetical protein [Clostridium beijerinckii]MBN7583170.1 hypothetical protein [Clostridium beijerinckii]MBO0519325.1 hypothetical protein [Clostridium beijerinckii]POO92343.1 hypothetical protein C1H57_05250 [Clostridium sp. 2-1]
MKKLFKFIGVFLLIVVILISVFLYIQINKPYTEVIDINWSIKLPDSYKEIYSIESIASVHGDGERYHIFEYTKEDDIDQSLNWESNKDKSIEAEIDKVLSGLNVPKENMPNFQSDYKYYIEKKDSDSSKLYLIFMTDTKKLFVIEDIL